MVIPIKTTLIIPDNRQNGSKQSYQYFSFNTDPIYCVKLKFYKNHVFVFYLFIFLWQYFGEVSEHQMLVLAGFLQKTSY